jgi:hypothetical protein
MLIAISCSRNTYTSHVENYEICRQCIPKRSSTIGVLVGGESKFDEPNESMTEGSLDAGKDSHPESKS